MNDIVLNKGENYLGNPNLKRSNVNVEFTQDQLEEFVKCANDPIYFIENYVKIVNLDEGFVQFKMYPFQKNMIETFHDNRFSICKVPRQSGKTTSVGAYILWYVLFNDNQNVAILANKGGLARDILSKIQLAFEALPKWMQQGVKIWNKGNIELENGSKIVASSTSGTAVRGGSYNLVFLDEFAFVPFNVAEDFFRSVYPTITSGKSTKVFIVSTPNGMNHFYKMWVEAQESRSSYVPIEVNWDDIPGRDQKFKEETIKNTSQEQWEQEFECQFLGSSNTLINVNTLRSLAHRTPIHSKDGLVMYEKPESGRDYFITVDTSRGVGLDYSAFTVIDITEVPYRVVCAYRNNEISPLLYPNVIGKVGRIYNEAYIMVEVNDIGAQIADILNSELEYENLLSSTWKGRSGQVIGGGFSKQAQLGIRTTKQVKRQGCATLKDLIEQNKLIVEDFDIINELSTFVSRNASYEAEDGSHDDLVMCLVMFSWVTGQPYFQEITDTNIRQRLHAEKMQMIEDELTPFGFVSDGVSERVETFVDTSGDRWFSSDW
jgi:hypothetical protein